MAGKALLVLRTEQSACDPADTALTEASLQTLYGVTMRRVCVEHDGRELETPVPMLGVSGKAYCKGLLVTTVGVF